MIDQTTKAKEGTRLRFKLLDDVTVSGTRLKKNTYLYGTVTGFGQQRVRAAITSILVGGKFIKVNLSVFDNDGMEGFYVPESAFRDFVKDAGASTVQQNISLNRTVTVRGFPGRRSLCKRCRICITPRLRHSLPIFGRTRRKSNTIPLSI